MSLFCDACLELLFLAGLDLQPCSFLTISRLVQYVSRPVKRNTIALLLSQVHAPINQRKVARRNECLPYERCSIG